jgi:hypothetical protein
MTYIAADPQTFLGQSVGNGQCVALVRKAANVPATAAWRKGALAKGDNTLQRGTIIATFDPNGLYGNHTDGRSHAAIYLAQNATGLQVIDQWVAHATAPRTIRFRGGVGKAVNDGDQFNVVQ